MKRKIPACGVIGMLIVMAMALFMPPLFTYSQDNETYPASIKKLPLVRQTQFIQFVKDRGWFEVFITEITPKEIKLVDGLGKAYSISWDTFFQRTAQWRNDQINDFFDQEGIEPKGEYPDSIKSLTTTEKIRFGQFIARKGWYQQNILAISEKDKIITLMDNLGFLSTISYSEFYTTTSKWESEALWEWNQLMKIGKIEGKLEKTSDHTNLEEMGWPEVVAAILIAAAAVAGLVTIEWVTGKSKRNNGEESGM